jgi:hypothetical protein
MPQSTELEQINMRIIDILILVHRRRGNSASLARLTDEKNELEERKKYLETNLPLTPSPIFKNYRELPRPPTCESYSSESDYISLDQGFFNLGEARLLFCREDFHALYQHLFEQVLLLYQLVYILGSPGVGKTATVKAFISALDANSWQIVWIRIDREYGQLQCVILEPTAKKEFSAPPEAFSDVLSRFANTNLRQLVVLDGIRDFESHRTLQGKCVLWKSKNTTKNQVVFISSMKMRIYAEDDSVQEFRVSAWKLEELIEAVDDDDFFEQVRSYLDVTNQGTSRGELVTAKFHFTGGSVLDMFAKNTAKIRRDIDEIVLAMATTTVAPGSVINIVHEVLMEKAQSIYKRIPTSEDAAEYEVIIASKYLFDRIAASHGSAIFAFLKQLFQAHKNPSMIGWIFEEEVVQNLQNTGIHFVKKSNRELGHWPMSKVYSFPCNYFPVIFPMGGHWYRPIEFNAAGYDACYIHFEDQYLRIVQITHGKKHDCNLKH